MNSTTNNLKTLVKANGLLGVIGGIFSFIFATLAFLAMFKILPPVYILFVFLAWPIRIAFLVMGIIGLVKLKNTTPVPIVAHIFLIITLPSGLLIAMFADIFAIIAGIVYLTSLKKFDQAQPLQQQFPNQPFQ